MGGTSTVVVYGIKEESMHASTGVYGGVGGVLVVEDPWVKREHRTIRSRSSVREIRRCGFTSKILWRMKFNSSEMGKMVCRKLRSFMKALKVESSIEARFHGLRPQVRLTRITPSAQMSLGADS